MNSQKPNVKATSSRNARLAKKNNSQAIILILLTVIIAITALCFIIMSIINNSQAPQNITGNTIIFYDANYDYNIMEDENYLILDRNVRFENSHNGLTIEIVDDNLNDVPSDIRESFIVINNFIDYAIRGKYDELNSLFSDEYVEADGELKMNFTMQQLYNIKITYITDTTTESNGYSYPSQDFWLEYMIRKNNGTFRNDMPSDCIKKEYVRVTNRNGDHRIDVLTPFNTVAPEHQTISGNTITLIVIVTLLMLSIVITFSVFITKRFRK